MNCKDLMVGDWVRFKENYPQKELQGKIAKVKGVRGRIDVKTQDGEYYESEHPDWLEPIPLTEEILVKNGWRKEPVTIDIDDDYAIWLGEILISQDEDEFNYEDIELKYVHTMQHLLRLCGIEKELTI